METFCLPYREILERFTKSELLLMGWRSQEQSYKWKKKSKKLKQDDSDEIQSGTKGIRRKVYHDGVGPERMPDRFYAQETLKDERGRVIADAGDFNLAQVPGEDARRYFESVLKIPLPPGVSKIRAEGEVEDQIRNAYNIRR